MDNCSAFDINNNDFSGSPSTISILTDQGSHGIIFNNSDAKGGECYKNTFVGTDYAIHTQAQNQTLRIRCNDFAVGSAPHQISALFVQDGSLRNQGNGIACITNPAEAAGNHWKSSVASGFILTEQDISNINGVPFYYFASALDEFSNPTTVPN
ncbi:MAG: hypothetical protein WCH34_17510, partial [Bacteroidota bacterium]